MPNLTPELREELERLSDAIFSFLDKFNNLSPEADELFNNNPAWEDNTEEILDQVSYLRNKVTSSLREQDASSSS